MLIQRTSDRHDSRHRWAVIASLSAERLSQQLHSAFDGGGEICTALNHPSDEFESEITEVFVQFSGAFIVRNRGIHDASTNCGGDSLPRLIERVRAIHDKMFASCLQPSQLCCRVALRGTLLMKPLPGMRQFLGFNSHALRFIEFAQICLHLAS